MYSDGARYPPALKFLTQINHALPLVNNVLVLGTGLASIAQIIHKKGFYPQFTLVEIDEVVLKWALEFAGLNASKLNPVCADAEDFMKINKTKFDLIFIDIFNGRVVPAFVTGRPFLEQCRESLSANGSLGFNYIINDDDEWEKDRAIFTSIFPAAKLISFDMNRVFVVDNTM